MYLIIEIIYVKLLFISYPKSNPTIRKSQGLFYTSLNTDYFASGIFAGIFNETNSSNNKINEKPKKEEDKTSHSYKNFIYFTRWLVGVQI